MTDQTIWVEKYRPKSVDDCILPTGLKSIFSGIVKKGEVPNMVLSGGPGMGKTTIARAMCDEIGLEYLLINAADERGVDLVRVRIPSYASTMAFNGKRKVLILDEADNLTPDAQSMFRGCVEAYSSNCSFILTCNHRDKIITPVISRCPVVDFKIPKEEKKEIFTQLFQTVCTILEKEEVKYDKKVIAELIGRYFPDIRLLLGELQIFSNQNSEINAGILSSLGDLDVSRLIAPLKEKNFTAVREWIVSQSSSDPSKVYRKLYDALKNYLKPGSLPGAVVLLSQYQYRAAFSVDQEICLLAFLTELMAESEWN